MERERIWRRSGNLCEPSGDLDIFGLELGIDESEKPSIDNNKVKFSCFGLSSPKDEISEVRWEG